MAGADTITQAFKLGATGDNSNQAGWSTGTSNQGAVDSVAQPDNANSDSGTGGRVQAGGGGGIVGGATDGPPAAYSYYAPGKEAPVDQYSHTVNPDGSFSTQPPGMPSPTNMAQYSSATSPATPDKNQQSIALSGQLDSPAMQAIKAGMPDYQASNTLGSAESNPGDLPPNPTPTQKIQAGLINGDGQSAPLGQYAVPAGGWAGAPEPSAPGRAMWVSTDAAQNAQKDAADQAHSEQFRQAHDAWAQANPGVPSGMVGASGSPSPDASTGTPPVQPVTAQSAAPATTGTAVTDAINSGMSFDAWHGQSPELAQQYLDALPDPQKIVSPVWNRLKKDTQAFLLGAYEKKGFSANDVLDTIDANLPGGGESYYWSPDFTSAYRLGGRAPKVTG